MHRRLVLAPLSLALAMACGSPPAPAAPSPRLPSVSDGAAPERPGNYIVRATERRERQASSFRWASGEAAASASAVSAASARTLLAARGPAALARAHLGALAATQGFAAEDLATAETASVHDTGQGAVIVRFRQRIGGVEVLGGGAAVAMDRAGALVATTGELAPVREVPEGAAFTLGAAEAVGLALTDVSGQAYAAGDLVTGPARGGYDTFGLRSETAGARGVSFSRDARAKQVWFRLAGGLEPAWYVEIGLRPPGARVPLEYGYVLSARSGRLLLRKDQVVHAAFTYRVFASPTSPYMPYDGPQGFAGSPHPTGVPDGYAPPYVAPQDVTIQSAPFSKNDPWLAANATETTGNNVDAYADLVADQNNGFAAGDVRGAVSAPGKFQYTYDLAGEPGVAASRQAAVVQLFYVNNWLHDWYYDAGFAEADGNAQAVNYGRGGAEGDALVAQAQDVGGFDNANMATPADGASPRMQMYLWVTPTPQFVKVNAPASVQLQTGAGIASEWGPQSFDLTGDVVAAQNGTKADGCTALTNGAAVKGKIALVDRGNCTFVVKAKAAQDAGAIGVIIRNVNDTQTLVNMASDNTPAAAQITIPPMLIGLAPGKTIGDAVAAGTVNVSMTRTKAPLRDGDLDTSIVAHEWGHYIAHRLVHDSAGLNSDQANGMGEGWSDFHALLLMVRDEDRSVASNANFSGVYGVGAYATGGSAPSGGPNDSYYFAIRRVPYSTDMTKNPLSFRHIQDGVELVPAGSAIPVAFGRDGSANSEVHDAGEVWATMLWECYAALLRDTGGTSPRLTFAQAQDRMKRYLVAHYKLLPFDPTFLEARDALLAVALAEDPADFTAFHAAFAKRGAGIGAVNPDRYAAGNQGVVESTLTGPLLAAGQVSVGVIDPGACNDGDGILDNGETGTVSVTLDNVGATDLAAVTATLSTTAPDKVSFPAGTSVAVGGTVPLVAHAGGQPSTVATFKVAIAHAARAEVVPLTLTFPAGYLTENRTVPVSLRVNYDQAAAVGTTDDFESSIQAWTTAGSSGASPWTRVALDAGRHVMHGPDAGQPGETSLVSPAITLGSAAATITLHQRYAFEGDAATAWFDGALVEISQDGGATWADLGAAVKYAGTAAYGGTISSNQSQNPLAGKLALVGTSPGYPAFSPLTLDLGTTYAGKTVKLRLRIGTDELVGAPGWDVDDVVVTGATNTPFPAIQPDALVCAAAGGIAASAGGAQIAAENTLVTLDATGSASEDPAKVLTYAWTQVGSPTVSLSSATAAKPTFTAPEVTADTTLTFQVTVSDGASTPSSAQTTVKVLNVNKPPVASAGSNQSVKSGDLVHLDATGSTDADPGTTLTYAWTQISGVAVTLLDANTAAATFNAPAVANAVTTQFRVTVSDGAATSAANVIVTISPVGGGTGATKKTGGCGTAGAAGPLALLAVAFLRRRRSAAGAR
ncbi:MAG: myxosortase-dependent M36 family metallopeptidase [Anaeromyxobacter sp.]